MVGLWRFDTDGKPRKHFMMFDVLVQAGQMLMQQAILWDKLNRWHRVISDVHVTRVPHVWCHIWTFACVCAKHWSAIDSIHCEQLRKAIRSFFQDSGPTAENALAGILQCALNSMISLDYCCEQCLNTVFDHLWLPLESSMRWQAQLRSTMCLCWNRLHKGMHENDWMPLVFDILLHLPWSLHDLKTAMVLNMTQRLMKGWCLVTLHYWIALPRIATGKCSEALFWTACPERKRWLRNSDTWWKWPEVTEWLQFICRTVDCGVMLVCLHRYTQEVHTVCVISILRPPPTQSSPKNELGLAVMLQGFLV